ncbi:uncharacterized protein TRIREDRAFT_123914 [Trichoderma reesei QM6a]|uniref:Predicted protein n=1 Tax=Hypocrea jecorina (strain QM6a) TaxID=431241 RepID=G0RV47_HYPJQ|nr:uncharacterized protein TRIREDRAFT_123914 [Trichoderma reesei QM6a]EGR44984.1 predicted protein [Trichoderma reesei QM6a]
MKAPTIALLAALGGFQAAVAQRIGSSGVWVDAATCDPWAKSHGFPAAAGPGGLLTTALGILDSTSMSILYRMYHPTTQSQKSLPANVLAWERYRLNSTYDALYGNNTDTKTGEVGVWDVVKSVWGVHFQWGKPMDEEPYIFLVCDDAPYLHKTNNGTFIYTDPYRHASMEISTETWQIEKFIGPCATNGQSSYDIQNNNNWSQNLVLCTKNMDLPLGLTSKGPNAFASGTTIDVAGRSWLGALWSQALWSGGAVSSPRIHGFAASHAIRNTKSSLWNADSGKFYAFSFMLDGLFWGSGVGRTSQQEYANLQKTAAGKKIIAAFGLTNIAVPARGINWVSGWEPPSMWSNPSEVPDYMGAIPTS